MKIKITTVFFAMLLLALSVLTASADQEGNARWCNIDNDGCYLIEADGSHSYMYFWSEAARKHYMGDITKPYENVVTRYYSKDGKHPLDAAPKETRTAGKVKQASVKDWFKITLPNGGLVLMQKGLPAEWAEDMYLTDKFSDILGSSAAEVLIPVYEGGLCVDCTVPMVIITDENGNMSSAQLLENIPEEAKLVGYISASDVRTHEGDDSELLKTLEDSKPDLTEESDDTHDGQDSGSHDDHSDSDETVVSHSPSAPWQPPAPALPLAPVAEDEQNNKFGDDQDEQSTPEDTPWYNDEETAKQIFDFMKQYDPEFQEKSDPETGTQIDFEFPEMKYYTWEEIIEILTLAGALDEFEKQFGDLMPKSITGSTDFIISLQNSGELRIAGNGDNNNLIIIGGVNNNSKPGDSGENRLNNNDQTDARIDEGRKHPEVSIEDGSIKSDTGADKPVLRGSDQRSNIDRSGGEKTDRNNSGDSTEFEWQGGSKDEYNKPSIYINGNSTLYLDQYENGNGDLIFSFYGGMSGIEQDRLIFEHGTVAIKGDAGGFKRNIDLAEGSKFEIRNSDDSSAGNDVRREGNIVQGAPSNINVKEHSMLNFGSGSGDSGNVSPADPLMNETDKEISNITIPDVQGGLVFPEEYSGKELVLQGGVIRLDGTIKTDKVEAG